MKLLIIILLAGELLTVTEPQWVAAPDVPGVLAQMPHDQTTFVYAHSNLSGTLFYDLERGETVTAIYNDGSQTVFEVIDTAHHSAQSTEIAKQGGVDFDLRVNYQLVRLSDVMSMYSTPGGITFITCFSDNKGFGIVTGRLFVQLAPVEEE